VEVAEDLVEAVDEVGLVEIVIGEAVGVDLEAEKDDLLEIETVGVAEVEVEAAIVDMADKSYG
jgi:hypothetical protein